jgi:sugar phosphate isomerase/epimerase
MPEPQRSKVFARAERKFDVMQELGCDLLMVCSNVSEASLGGIDRAAADFHELGERAAKRGMRVAFEALAWGRHIHDYRDAWEVVRRADHPAVGLVLDSFHILARRTDLSAIRAIPKDRIFLVQMADAPKLDMDYLSWSRHHRCFPGQGDLAIDDFMEALHATGFDGLLSLEIFNDRFRAGSRAASRWTGSAPSWSCSTNCGAGPARPSPRFRTCPRRPSAPASSSWNSRWTSGALPPSRGCWPASASARRDSTAPRRWRAGGRAASTSW